MGEALSLAEYVVLALVAETETHGFAVGRLLAPRGEVGQVFTVARPAVYRAIGRLVGAGMVAAAGVEPGDAAPARTLLQVTPTGRARLDTWLAEPVHHVRDLRTDFLVKLALLDRAGRDRLPLVEAQRRELEPIVAGLVGLRPVGSGVDALVAAWRRSAGRAALAFLDDLQAPDAPSG